MFVRRSKQSGLGGKEAELAKAAQLRALAIAQARKQKTDGNASPHDEEDTAKAARQAKAAAAAKKRQEEAAAKLRAEAQEKARERAAAAAKLRAETLKKKQEQQKVALLAKQKLAKQAGASKGAASKKALKASLVAAAAAANENLAPLVSKNKGAVAVAATGANCSSGSGGGGAASASHRASNSANSKTWAEKQALEASLLAQTRFHQLYDIERIFGEVPRCDIKQIFPHSKNKDLMRSRRSSGNWLHDRVTADEQQKYDNTFEQWVQSASE